jgi:BA14K-like protein
MRRYLSTLACSGMLTIGALSGFTASAMAIPAFNPNIAPKVAAAGEARTLPAQPATIWNLACTAANCDQGGLQSAVLLHTPGDPGAGVQLVRDGGDRAYYISGRRYGIGGAGWRGNYWRGGRYGIGGAGWRGNYWRGRRYGIGGAGWRGNYWRGGWHGVGRVGWRGAYWRGGSHGIGRPVGWRGRYWRGGWHGIGWRPVGWRGVGWRGNYWRGGFHGFGGSGAIHSFGGGGGFYGMGGPNYTSGTYGIGTGWGNNWNNNWNWGTGFFGFGAPLFGATTTYAAAPVVATPVMSTAHVAWCFGRYRTYSAADNTFQPFNGPRVACVSPF